MRRLAASFSAFTLALAALTATSTASLATFYPRTYVSGSGNDSNYCTRTEPCRTFQRAFDRTFVNGEINCLDAAGYGTVTITRSVTIDCKEVPASIVAGEATGVNSVGVTISIPANSASDPLRTVRLRGFTISGAGQAPGTSSTTGLGNRYGVRGIAITSASAVFIEHLVISDFTQQGILDSRTTGPTKLFILDTVVRNNAGAGVVPYGPAGAVVVLDNVRSESNLHGLAIGVGNSVMANRSVFSGNKSAGVEIDAGAFLNVNNSVLSHNVTGVLNFGIVRLSNNDIAFNATGITGPSVSFGNNRFSNTAPGTLPTPAGGVSTDLGQQ